MWPKEQFIIKQIKSNQFSPPPPMSVLYDWGLVPEFLAFSALSNGGRGGDFRAKEEFLLGP